MTLLIQARFENGVFVPETKVDFSEHQRVTLSIDTNVSIDPDDPNDPRPAGGVELVDWQARHRLQLPPEVVAEIMSNPEYNIENS